MPSAEHEVRYEADDRPPLPLTIGLAIQYAVVALGGVVLTPAILISVAGQSEAYLNWAVFAALVVSGSVTVVQSVRLGRIGAGYILIMGSTTAFLPMSITALAEGGPALLATLIVMSSLVQFVLGAKMALLRRVFTPTVAGTVLMLIPVSLAPIVFKKMEDVPAGCVRVGGAGHGARDPGNHRPHRAPPIGSVARVGTCHWARGWRRHWARFRHLRHRAGGGCAMVRVSAVQRLSRPRPDLRQRLLGIAAGLPDRHVGWRDGHAGRCHRHSACLMAQAPRHRLPLHSRRHQRRRARQSAVRHRRHGAEHHLWQRHRHRRVDGHNRSFRRRVGWDRVRRPSP